MKSMTLYMRQLTRKAWKGFLLFYWRSIAERQKRKLQHLQNLRFLSNRAAPKERGVLQTPMEYKKSLLLAQQRNAQQQSEAGSPVVSMRDDMCGFDWLSSDEEDGGMAAEGT